MKYMRRGKFSKWLINVEEGSFCEKRDKSWKKNKRDPSFIRQMRVVGMKSCNNFNKWYFVTKIVLTYYKKNVLKKHWKSRAEGQEFAKILRSIAQFVGTMKGQNNLCLQNYFLTCSWRFLICNELGQLDFKLEKDVYTLRFRNMQEKGEKALNSVHH